MPLIDSTAIVREIFSSYGVRIAKKDDCTMPMSHFNDLLFFSLCYENVKRVPEYKQNEI